ncbi:MAG: hypothetical protein JW982_11410 [Spirochaetes bacterium]|nr:hypothetical protein [Spirochaetota bacterium]
MFAAPKNRSVDLLTDIDRNLIKLKNDPLSIYYKSLKQWTSDDIKFELPLWMKIFALILAIILFMSLFGSIILKRQVNVRTMQLRQINKEIEQRIIERTSQLQDTNKKLSSEIDERKKSETLLKQTFEELTLAKESAESADRLKSAFLATMSHELRTPLNSIIGFTGIILQGIVGDLNDEQKKQLNMVKTSAQHLLALINDILDISKIEAGQLQIVNENYNLREIIEKVTETTRPLATQKGLEITCSISPEIGSIEGDRRRVEQILLNLISNAIKFTEKGSVKIDCQTEKDSLILSVTDTGIGIKQNDIETICIPFRQIDTGLTRKYEGTGLGLSICKKLVELMDGYLWISSVYGEGSVFSFSLPNKRSDK